MGIERHVEGDGAFDDAGQSQLTAPGVFHQSGGIHGGLDLGIYHLVGGKGRHLGVLQSDGAGGDQDVFQNILLLLKGGGHVDAAVGAVDQLVVARRLVNRHHGQQPSGAQAVFLIEDAPHVDAGVHQPLH